MSLQGLTVSMVIVGGISLSILSAVSASRAESSRTEREFQQLADGRSQAIGEGLDEYARVLDFTRRLFRASEHVSAVEFETFVRPFLDEQPGILALEWVAREQLPVVDGGTGEGFIVRFVEPMDRRRNVTGTDLLDDPTGRAAVYRAIDDGQAMSPLASHLEGGAVDTEPSSRWVRILLPVYKGTSLDQTVEERRKNLKGLVAAVIDPIMSMNIALNTASGPSDAIDTFVLDFGDPDKARIVYSQLSPQRSSGDRRHFDAEDVEDALHNRHIINVAGQPLAVVSVPTQAFFRTRETWFAWGILAAGAACSGLLAACISLIDRRARAVDQVNRDLRREIEERRSIQDQLVSAKESAELANVELQQQISERLRAEDQRSKSESRMRELAENIRDVLYVTDLTGRTILYISPAYETVWGRSTERLLGNPDDWFEAIHPDDRDSVIESRASAALEPVQLQYRIIRDDGVQRWVEDRSVPVRGENGVACRIVGIAEDITERKLAAEHLAQAHDELRDSQMQLIQVAKLESVGRLAAGVAHEVKNPLATILLGLNYLVDEGLAEDPTRQKVITSMESSVRRADKVIRGLLDFAAPRELCIEPGSMNDAIEDALLLVRGDLLHGHVDVQRDFAPDLPQVQLDPSKMEQVFINVFVNACQAMSEGGSISISTAIETCRSGPVVVVQVDDTGKGIPEDKLDKVFDPFFTTKPIGEGTGLGLSVSKKIIDLHHGTIEFSNRSEGGARVRLTFPAITKEGEPWTRSGFSSSTTK